MADARPDPDKLLALAKAEEARSQRGKLKVYFGAAPGVGKTFEMLRQANLQRGEGVDVAIGVVETHGRKETEALVQNLELLPRAELEYKGTRLHEFDLDGALKRHPTLILVDELAHTNAPGSRHAKRWQDVEELLQAGINVWTTLNVQHVDSLNDVVARITHVIVQETVPDAVFDNADEIEFVDIPVDDLIKRLSEGRVYFVEQAAHARENFFRKGNLLALRELALRRTAERVNTAVRDYRRAAGITSLWPTRERLLVAVGPSPYSTRLIRATKRMADALQAPWHAVSVETPHRLSQDARERVEQNLQFAFTLGVETTTISGDSVADALLDFSRSHNVTRIIAGKPTHARWRDFVFGSLLEDLTRRSGEIDILVITGEGEAGKKPVTVPRAHRLEWNPYLFALASVGMATAAGFVMFEHAPLADITMIYLLGVVVVAVRRGLGAAIAASVLSVIAFNFCFVPPRFTFSVADASYLITFTTMAVTGVIVALLTARVRSQVALIRDRERRTNALYEISQVISKEREPIRLATAVGQKLRALLGVRILVIVPTPETSLYVCPLEDIGVLDDHEFEVVRWVQQNGKPAGASTDTLAGSKGLYLPLQGSQSVVGVAGVVPEQGLPALDSASRLLLDTACGQLAAALERLLLAEQMRGKELEIERERLRSSLLSSVSHDLRTPLASITGAASTLLDESAALDADARRELLLTIADESARMGRLVTNLLEMTRLESGTVKLRREWSSLEELIGAALARLGPQLKEHDVRTAVPADLPLVPVDAVLIEQVLNNLIENAAKYAPARTPIEVSARPVGGEIEVVVADRGPGIVPGEEELIFEKFRRGSMTGSLHGVGLGLSVCKGIIEVHGGTISAANRPGGGAEFRFRLPVPEQPRIEPEET